MTTEIKREFATPFAMKCDSKERFNEAREGLESLNYKIGFIDPFSDSPYLSIDNGMVVNVSDFAVLDTNRIVIETFNPDLCLALAAMSKGDVIFEGEWWYDGYGNVGKYNDLEIKLYNDGKAVVYQKATADQLIEHFTKAEVKAETELQKLSEVEDAKIGKKYLDRDGNIVECVENSTCVPCFFNHNDKNCVTVSCRKEDRKDKKYVVFELVKKSEIPTSTHKTITFASEKEMAKFLVDGDVYSRHGDRYFSKMSPALRFYIQYPSGGAQELTNGWCGRSQTFYLSNPTIKPEIVLTYDEARHLIAQMKQVEFEQITIKNN